MDLGLAKAVGRLGFSFGGAGLRMGLVKFEVLKFGLFGLGLFGLGVVGVVVGLGWLRLV